jgi:hypothetical protein
MGIDVEKDCVVRPDGTHVCFDQEKEAFYQFKRLSMSDVNEKDVAEIMRKRCNVKAAKGEIT